MGKLVKPFMHVQHEVSDAAAFKNIHKIDHCIAYKSYASS